MGKRFLITGATGFVGSHLTRRLVVNGEDVHILIRRESNQWRLTDVLNKVKKHEVDLKDRDGLQEVVSKIKPDIIYHCAAYGVCPGQHGTTLSIEANLTGTVNLIEALMKVDYKCLVHTGSSAEYGRKETPMKETDILKPETIYGVTKAAASLYCQAMARFKKQPIIILRLMSPYGPYDEPNRLIPAVIMQCLAGKDPKLSTGEESRSFFFMDDLIDLYLKVPYADWLPGEIVNVGADKQYSVRDIATKIIELTDAKVRPLFGAFPPREFDTTFWIADVKKVKSLFDWTAKVGIDEGLERTIEWYRTFNKNVQQLANQKI